METANQSTTTLAETRLQCLEHTLSREPFTGLKAILDRLTSNRQALCDHVTSVNTFEELLSRLGHPVTLIPQIHVQDSYSRLGPQGGIKAVLPYHDIPTHSSLPMLINLDSTVTATPNGVAFFSKLLVALKAELASRS